MHRVRWCTSGIHTVDVQDQKCNTGQFYGIIPLVIPLVLLLAAYGKAAIVDTDVDPNSPWNPESGCAEMGKMLPDRLLS